MDDTQTSRVSSSIFSFMENLTLLFVCTGNTCRSPLAVAAWEAFGAPLLRDTAYEGRVKAVSAGLSAVEGIPVAHHAAAIARSWGVDIARHRARALTTSFAQRVDYGLCMTPAHREALRPLLSQPSHARLLAEFASESQDEDQQRLSRLLGSFARDYGRPSLSIVDPIGGSREAYTACAQQIRVGIEGLARALGAGTLNSRS